MKVLICNKFYYYRGGDCNFSIGLESLLKSHGHDVAFFSMDYPLNMKSEWSSYWPSNMTSLKAINRPMGSCEVINKFTRLCDEFKPDVVHLNNIHTQLSPVIAEIAHNKNIRVVWTLHDSKLVCPSYSCSRRGKFCTDCITHKMSVIKHKCIHGSLLKSIMGYMESRKWSPDVLENNVDFFLPPSQFMLDLCLGGGYHQEKFKLLPNFVDISKVSDVTFDKDDYYVYVGRLSSEKGIGTLCRAAHKLPYRLIVVGGGDLEEELRNAMAFSENIEFVGKKSWVELRPILEHAKFMVIPSECSENNPLSVIESLSLGTPVLGARIGGIPELIEEGISGMAFESGNYVDMMDKIRKMWDLTFDYQKISNDAIAKYNSEVFYQKLMKIYQGL